MYRLWYRRKSRRRTAEAKGQKSYTKEKKERSIEKSEIVQAGDTSSEVVCT
jgi:hypothetical protein